MLFLCLLVPFLGTAAGAACVLFLRQDLPQLVQKVLLGFASGVMTAAAVWSLLLPAVSQAAGLGRLAFLPAAAGFSLGVAFLLAMDRLLPHLHLDAAQPEGPPCHLGRQAMLFLAVTIHNIPEGMAVGITFAGFLSGQAGISLAGAAALAVGIAIQNFPEGALVSLPMKAACGSRGRAFLYGLASGVVEPAGAALTLLLTRQLLPFLPYLLAFAAGAMMYVVVEELLPEASQGPHSNLTTLGFAAGFLLMMILDTALQ